MRVDFQKRNSLIFNHYSISSRFLQVVRRENKKQSTLIEMNYEGNLEVREIYFIATENHSDTHNLFPETSPFMRSRVMSIWSR
jgi:hypothetical protein